MVFLRIFNGLVKKVPQSDCGYMSAAAILFYGFGALTERYQLIWLCAPSYVAVALCVVQIPVFLYAYMYFSKWQQWNSGLK